MSDRSILYDFNRGWLFGGEHVSQSETPGFDDSRFTQVTLPHTVTNFSLGHWKSENWRKKWIYRKRFDTSVLPPGRVVIDFDCVMTGVRAFFDGHAPGSTKADIYRSPSSRSR